MRVAVIYNPNSTGDSQANAEELVARLNQDSRHAAELMATDHAGHAQDLARDFAMRHKQSIVVSSSGDGGYNEVINGLMEAKAKGAQPLAAVLPAGNANDHDRAIRDNTLTQAVIAAEPKAMDLLEVTMTPTSGKAIVRYAHSYVGLGLTPAVAVELNKHSLTAVKELVVVVRSFARFKPLTIRRGGREMVLDSLVLSNIDGMAKVLKLAQKSSTSDGIFEINAFAHGHKLRLLARLLRGATFGLQPTARASDYEFTVTKAMPMQLDGEVVKLAKDTRVRVSCARHAIQTLA